MFYSTLRGKVELIQISQCLCENEEKQTVFSKDFLVEKLQFLVPGSVKKVKIGNFKINLHKLELIFEQF